MPPFKVTKNTAPTEVIIPEGYEIQMTLTSLTPETKNLMFDSINNPVKSYEESEPFLPGSEENLGKLVKQGSLSPTEAAMLEGYNYLPDTQGVPEKTTGPI